MKYICIIFWMVVHIILKLNFSHFRSRSRANTNGEFYCHLLVKRLNIIQNDPRMVYTFENDRSCTQLHTSIA